MAVHSPPLRRSRRERLAGWVVTGPLGHLYSALADLAAFAARLIARRLPGRS